MGGEGVYKILVKKLEGKTPLGRPRRRWEDNIKMDLQELDGEEWIDLSYDKNCWRTFVNAVMNIRIS